MNLYIQLQPPRFDILHKTFLEDFFSLFKFEDAEKVKTKEIYSCIDTTIATPVAIEEFGTVHKTIFFGSQRIGVTNICKNTNSEIHNLQSEIFPADIGPDLGKIRRKNPTTDDVTPGMLSFNGGF